MNQTHEWVLIAFVGIAFTSAMMVYLGEEFSESVDSIKKKTASTVEQINEQIRVIDVRKDASGIRIYVMNYGNSEIQKRATVPSDCISENNIVPRVIHVIYCYGDPQKITLLTENFNAFTVYDKT